MLVLTRRKDQSILIGDNILIHICGINGNQVKIGITAPRGINITRDDCVKDRHKNIIDYDKKD